MSEAPLVFDVGPGEFEEQVMEASRQHPIVVDFWAAWCAPCLMLGPLLERVVRSYGGRFRLARLDVEQHQEEAQRYGIRGIPAVKVFRDGKVVSEFVGALPEGHIRRALDQALPGEADESAREGDRLGADGSVSEARERYEQALESTPNHPGALLRLAQLAAQEDQPEEARSLLARIPEGSPEWEEGRRLAVQVEFTAECGGAGGREQIEARVREDPEVPQAHYQLACCLAADGRYQEALEEFLQTLRLDRDFRSGAAKEAVLRVFRLVGEENEMVREYRRQLASILF
ncbi:MAG: tetratricopeptide repeat protein [Planctomycetes bacterium]|nr:tetratricopeptide repeat protein [Planctomycetota bacterium]